MTALADLRARLLRLKRRRAALRRWAAFTALASAILLVLALAMGLDWCLEMSRAQRAVSLLLAAIAAGWAYRRYVRPWLGVQEQELDLALLVERNAQIDSDLVAAIQFESPAAPLWGSVALEEAVIEAVAQRGPRLAVEQQVPRRRLRRQTALFAAGAAIWVLLVLFAPRHVAVFLNRFFLGNRHYPTRTAIDEITINGRWVDPLRPSSAVVKVPTGGSIEFLVRCSGKLPREGRADLTVTGGSATTIVDLTPVPTDPQHYRGRLPRLNESAVCQFYLNDAWTEPAWLEVVDWPVADLEFEVTPPPYAADHPSAKVAPGLRQILVLEGSRVVVRLKAEKPLQSATLTISDQRHALHADRKGNARRWSLDAPEGPLSAVVEPLQFSIQVQDRDGLALEQPIEGGIRILPDRPPEIAASILTPQVLSTARPTIAYKATDDFALGRITILRQVVRAAGGGHEDEVVVYQAADGEVKKLLDARYAMDLAPLELAKGDQVKVTLRAVDFRGPRAGQSSLSEPLVFRVTDTQGILQMMLESDRKSAEQMQKMLDRQLGIGGSP